MTVGSPRPDFEPPSGKEPGQPAALPPFPGGFAGPPRPPAPIRAPGRQVALIVAVSLAAVLVLLVAVDRAASRLAGDRVATVVQNALGVEQRPVVRIGGFPFLTQVVSRRYQRITITAHGIPIRSTNGHLTIDELDATLVGVRPDAFYRTVGIGHFTATATIGYASLTDYVGTSISYDNSGANGSGYVTIAIGKPFTMTGRPAIDRRTNGIYLRQAQFRIGGHEVPGANPGNLAELFWFPLPTLFGGARVSSVRAGPKGLVLTAAGTNLTLRR